MGHKCNLMIGRLQDQLRTPQGYRLFCEGQVKKWKGCLTLKYLRFNWYRGLYNPDVVSIQSRFPYFCLSLFSKSIKSVWCTRKRCFRESYLKMLTTTSTLLSSARFTSTFSILPSATKQNTNAINHETEIPGRRCSTQKQPATSSSNDVDKT